MTRRVFLYGTLLDPELFEIVAGVPFEARPASLTGYAVRRVQGNMFPIAVADSGEVAEGVVIEADEATWARLDFYEIGFRTADVTVETAAGPIEAAVFLAGGDWAVEDSWSLAAWQAAHGRLARLVAREFMGLRESHPAEDAVRALPQIRMRAASRLRAMDEPTPEPLEPKMSGTIGVPEATEQPYTDYFAVREDWIAFPRFDGGKSPVVKRATFLGGDAVTVLPYDPKAETVLTVRQFRHGVFSRGDGNPWTLEPPAGRIDPGETPEATARRELEEEAGLSAGALHLVGRYYPSPSAYSEYIFSYVAIADLDGRDGGIGGLADEAEDIMSHVLPLDDALAMIETGAVNTGPLIMSLTWLALNRDRLG